MHTASANTKIEPIRTFRDHLTVCRSGANVFSRSPYGHHGSAGNGDVRTADEASMMTGLTPVAAATRGARGESRREGVEWTCADLMLGVDSAHTPVPPRKLPLVRFLTGTLTDMC